MERKYVTNTAELKKEMIDSNLEMITELSEASGVDRNTLGKVVSGKIQPSADVMVRLATTLNLSSHRAGEIFFAEKLMQ